MLRTKWFNNKSILALILLLAGCLRFYNLGFQSFWLDELHTVIEADPALSWQKMFDYLRCCDQHPPLFFVIGKVLFLVFGSTELVARSFAAIAGIVAVWSIYLLGRELYSSKLGLIAATLCCFNYFHISYSQEARPYSLVFLFVCLSFLYLIRLIKDPSWKNSLLYCLWATLMIYTHYFGLFTFVSQAAILLFFAFSQGQNLKLYLKHSLIATSLIFIFYIPWISFLISMTAIKKFWIAPVSPTFAIDFFYEFFGNADLLKPFLLLFLVMGVIHFLWFAKPGNLSIKAAPLNFGFIICFLWISITYLIPYVRSVMVVPMLFPRYAIVVLPAFLLILSVGIESISYRIPKILLLCTFCFLSFFDFAILKKYYTQVHKTQFRELANFITSEKNFSYPVLSDATAWHQQYYLKKMAYISPVLQGDLNHQLDSILKNNSDQYNNKGFWLSSAHGSAKPDPEILKRIDSSFILFKQQNFYDAWARLYISRNAASKNLLMLDYHSFSTEKPFILNGDTVTAIWEKEIRSDTFLLKKGMYNIQVQIAGTPVSKVFPHIQVFINDKPVDNFYISETLKYYDLSFNNTMDCSVAIRIVMDNDANFESKGEDRNAFVKSIIISGDDKSGDDSQNNDLHGEGR